MQFIMAIVEDGRHLVFFECLVVLLSGGFVPPERSSEWSVDRGPLTYRTMYVSTVLLSSLAGLLN